MEVSLLIMDESHLTETNTITYFMFKSSPLNPKVSIQSNRGFRK